MGKLKLGCKLSLSISTGDKKKDGGDNKNFGGNFGGGGGGGGERKEGPIDMHCEGCTCATKSKESIKPFSGLDKAKCGEGKLKEQTVISGRGVDPPELHERFERILNRNVENNNNNNNNNGCNINNEGNSNKEESNCKCWCKCWLCHCKCCCGKQGEKREEDTEKAGEKKDGETKRNENDKERENGGDTNGRGGYIPIHDVQHGDRGPAFYGYGYLDPAIYGYGYRYRDPEIYGYGYKYPVATQSQMFIDEDPNACSVM